jgi:hypothetical protein
VSSPAVGGFAGEVLAGLVGVVDGVRRRQTRTPRTAFSEMKLRRESESE